MDIRDTTARLRRTFHYPTDDSSNGGTPEVLDEEGELYRPLPPPPPSTSKTRGKAPPPLLIGGIDKQTVEMHTNAPSPQTEQENLIQTLSEQNATTNQQYQTLLLALPILSSIPYFLALFRPDTLLTAVLGLTSLAATALLLLRLPATDTGFPLLDAWARSGSRHDSNGKKRLSRRNYDDDGDDDDGDYDDDEEDDTAGRGATTTTTSGMGALDQMRRQRRRRASSSLATTSATLLAPEPPRSPLARWLPYLNTGLCVLLVLSGLLPTSAGGGGGRHEEEGGGQQQQQHVGWLGLGNLPAIVYAVVILAKVVMASVDPERELAALRYGYKGA